MPQLILASGSPRRKDLLEEAGFTFEIVPPDIEELEDDSIGIRALTALNAKLKARAVAPNYPEQVVVAADTLVLFRERALGKPKDKDEASQMLAEMNGQTHHVYTAVCLIRQQSNQVVEFDVSTEVTFKQLSKEQRDHYHSLIDPMDKAGAYAAQDHGDLIIEKSVGSSTNVIGLPMEALTKHLADEFAVVVS